MTDHVESQQQWAWTSPVLPFRRVGFVTDVEGNLRYWEKHVRESAVLRFADGKSVHAADALELMEDCAFVFGGDAFDKGTGDLRIGAQLVSLKERFPDRVVLIMGNRDINKMRFTSELDDSDVFERPLEEVPGPFWIVEKQRVAPVDYLRTLAEESGDKTPIAATLQNLNTKANRLRYMLIHTLGCPDTFEFRRQELKDIAAEAQLGDVDVDDDAVVRSFLDSVVAENGVVKRYLELAVPAAVIGDTLFVHGAAEPAAVGFVPTDEHPYAVLDDAGGQMLRSTHDVRAWVDELCLFSKRSFQAWMQHPTWNKDRTYRGGQGLMAYQSRPAMHSKTVTVCSHGDGGNMPFPENRGRLGVAGAGDSKEIRVIDVSDPLEPKTVEYLNAGGVRRVLVGHKPVGDSPALLSYDASRASARSPGVPTEHGLELVTADISYSDTSSADNRGEAAWCEVLVDFDQTRQSSWCTVRGTLSDFRQYEFEMPEICRYEQRSEARQGDEFVGHVVELRELLSQADGGPWWVKAKLMPDNFSKGGYLLSRGRGRHVDYRVVRNGRQLKHVIPE